MGGRPLITWRITNNLMFQVYIFTPVKEEDYITAKLVQMHNTFFEKFYELLSLKA